MIRILAKSSTFIVLTISFVIFYFSFDSKKISTNVLDLFPKVEQREMLDIHSKLEDLHNVLIYTKGDTEALKEIDSIKDIKPLKDDIYLLSIDKDVKLEDFYDKFIEKIKDFDDIKYFSQDILNIENSRAIFDDINIIMASSISFLIILYLLILRIPYLSLNTIITIISANLLGISVMSIIYDDVNIMSLNFGIAIGNLAIDYMLHHHFFRIYIHKFKFNKSVFYGFLTTFIGFLICLFIPFPLLSQLSIYAMVCLLVSYLSFGISYQFIKFKKPIFYRNLRKLRKPKFSNKVILPLSILALAIALPNLKLDYHIERLDYENKARLSDRDYFTANLAQDRSIIIKADSKDKLDYKNQDSFISKILSKINPQDELKSDITNLKIEPYNGVYYAKINIVDSALSKVESLDFVDSRTPKELSDEITSGIYKPMIIILSLVIVIMLLIVLLITKSLISISFIITPLSVIFVFLLFGEVNIMHLFSLLIVVVSSVDYGIYVNKEGENICTLHAIIFSALTTLAGFGFLSFSNILALHSFGITILLGVGSILLLLLFQRRRTL